jgi:glycosyltransferase involved in cell wall biosynthesis
MSISYSVIIPAYNEEAWLDKTLAALGIAMNAVPMRGEVIVVNNNSDDKTPEIASQSGATIVFEPVNQISRARNAGARAASGKYLIFLDADTILAPELLKTALEYLSDNTCCGGGGRVVFDTELPWFARGVDAFWNKIAVRFGMAAGCFVYCLKQAFDDIGGFNEQVYASEEIWFSRRLSRWGKQHGMTFRIIPNPMLITSSRKLEWFSPLQILAKGLIILLFPFAVRFRSLCSWWYQRPEKVKNEK